MRKNNAETECDKAVYQINKQTVFTDFGKKGNFDVWHRIHHCDYCSGSRNEYKTAINNMFCGKIRLHRYRRNRDIHPADNNKETNASDY